MRKTTIQLLLLMLAGAIIFWREWAMDFSIVQQIEVEGRNATPLIDASPNTIIWLVGLACGVWLLTEVATRYLKLSSPNSV